MNNDLYNDPQTIIESRLPLEKMYFYLSVLADKFGDDNNFIKSKAELESILYQDDIKILKLIELIDTNQRDLDKIINFKNKKKEQLKHLLEKYKILKYTNVNALFIYFFAGIFIVSLKFIHFSILLIILAIVYYKLPTRYKQQIHVLNRQISELESYIKELIQGERQFDQSEYKNNLESTKSHKEYHIKQLQDLYEKEGLRLKTLNYLRMVKNTLRVR